MKIKNKILMSSEGEFYEMQPLKSKSVGKEDNGPLNIENFNRSKIHLIIEGKELFIEKMTIPKVRINHVEKIIQCALVQRFHSLKDIAFDYKIITKNKKEIVVLVYCLNLSRGILLEEDKFERIHFKSVKVIQQIYAQDFIKHLKKAEFYGLVISKRHIYFFHVKDKIIQGNRVEEFTSFQEIEGFINSLSRVDIRTKVLYLLEENPWKEVENLLLSIKDFYIFKIDFNDKKKKILSYDNNAVDL